MGLAQTTLDRFFPVPPQKTYLALQNAARLQFDIKSSDDFTLTISFSSGMSAFSWGENYTAQVLPAEGGSVVKVHGTGKMGGSVQQQSRTFKLVNKLLDAVTNSLRPTN